MDDKEFKTLINSENPVLVSIISRYCDPCFLQKAILEKVQKKIGKRIHIIAIDADNYPKLAIKYNAIARPALLLFFNRKLLWEQKEILSSELIIEKILEQTL